MEGVTATTDPEQQKPPPAHTHTHTGHKGLMPCVSHFSICLALVIEGILCGDWGIPAHNEGILDGSRNFMQCRFISIQSSHKRRYLVHTATLSPLRVWLPSTHLLVMYRAPTSRRQLISRQSSSCLRTHTILTILLRLPSPTLAH